MTLRRCVICGERPPAKDAQGNSAYAYPKNEEEALIWQISMAAKDCPVESIQKECCVCVEHIPDFVSRAKTIGKERSAQEKRKEEMLAAASKAEAEAKEKETETETESETEMENENEKKKKKEKAADECVPVCGEPAADREKPSVSVLLLNGSSLPTYCAEGEGSSCVDLQPVKIGDSKCIPTKRIVSKGSDTEIFVLESGFQDTGGKCPDIDGTEVTLLRAPTQEEDELERLREELMEEDEDPNVRRRRGCCLPGCTDVLLLGRGQHETDVCPCKCDECKKSSGLSDPDPCCKLECCPKFEPEYFTQPPCGCECEQQVRRELGKVIKTQALRILELEDLLCRQNNMRNCLQQKLDDLYCEFGRLDDAENAAYRSGISCPGSKRGGPDCASVRSAPPTYTPPPDKQQTESRTTVLSKFKMNKKMTSSTSKVLEELPPKNLRVHGFAEQKPEVKKRTRRPKWVNEAESEGQLASSTAGPVLAIKFNETPTTSGGNTASNPQESLNSDMAKPNSQSNVSRSIYSEVTRPNSMSNVSRSTYSGVTRPNSKLNLSRSIYSDVPNTNHSQSIFLDVTKYSSKSNHSISHRFPA